MTSQQQKTKNLIWFGKAPKECTGDCCIGGVIEASCISCGWSEKSVSSTSDNVEVTIGGKKVDEVKSISYSEDQNARLIQDFSDLDHQIDDNTKRLKMWLYVVGSAAIGLLLMLFAFSIFVLKG